MIRIESLTKVYDGVNRRFYATGYYTIGRFIFQNIDGLPVIAIGPYAFSQLNLSTTLRTITIPDSVTTLGKSAFKGCTALASVFFKGNAPAIGGTSWAYGCSNLVVYYYEGFTGFATPTWQGVPCYPIPAPTAAFSADVTSGCVPLRVNFTDLSTGATVWSWDFDGDGTVDSTVQNPTYIYYMQGIYTVKLTVSNSAGSDDEVRSDCIVVVPPYVEPLPGMALSSTDPDGDMRYEDLNGNGRLDFDDIVAYFENMQSIRDNVLVGAFPYDFNGNGLIDFDDIVTLYMEKIE